MFWRRQIEQDIADNYAARGMIRDEMWRCGWLTRVRNRVADLETSRELILENIAALNKSVESLTKRLRCTEEYGGHDWVFAERVSTPIIMDWMCIYASGETKWVPASGTYGPYKFKCSRCGHTRDFEWDELTQQDQAALIALGLHEETE